MMELTMKAASAQERVEKAKIEYDAALQERVNETLLAIKKGVNRSELARSMGICRSTITSIEAKHERRKRWDSE